MSDESEDLGATSVRLTFRTFRAHFEKLRLVAKAHGLSLSGAINKIIASYDASTEERAAKKKGRKT